MFYVQGRMKYSQLVAISFLITLHKSTALSGILINGAAGTQFYSPNQSQDYSQSGLSHLGLPQLNGYGSAAIMVDAKAVFVFGRFPVN